ncbi:MAG: TIGR02186 family protein [Rickettsiales bacterium]
MIVIVRGPEKNAIVRKKSNVSGVWINRHSEFFGDIPGFYAVASSRPMEEIPKSAYFPLIGIGEDNVLGASGTHESDIRNDFRRALLRDMRARRLYYQNAQAFSLISETLFKTAIPFPDTTPPGLYTAEVYLVSDGEISAAHMTPIRVYKTGIDAAIYELAHQQPYM